MQRTDSLLPPRRRKQVVWGPPAALVLLVWFSLGSLHVLVKGSTWWLPAAVVAASVIGAAAISRTLRPGRVVPSVWAGAALIGSLTAFFAADTSLFGVIPSPQSFGRAGDLVEAGQRSIVAQAVPAEATPGIVFILALAAGVVALTADALAFAVKAPAFSAIPALAFLVVPVVVRPGTFDAVFFVLSAAAYLGVLQLHRRRREPVRALALGSATLVLAVLIPNLLPGPGSLQAAGFSAPVTLGVNPVIDLGQDLRRGGAQLAFTYTTTSTEPLYFKLTTNQDFSGSRWEAILDVERPTNGVEEFDPPPGLTDEVVTAEVLTTVEVGRLVARWLPVPYPATRVNGLDGDWFWEPDGLSVRSNESSIDGQLYSVESRTVRPTAEQLASAGPPPAGMDGLLRLPPDLPANIAETALAVTQSVGNDYERALALQEFFTGGEFDYSEQTPVERDFDGTGAEAISDFLEIRSGYCVHFASAMAVMARALGIPSRVIVGFQPGTPQFQDGMFSHFEVTTHDLHAWPELYFDSVGWVRFEPTPGRGNEPDYDTPVVDDPATPDVDESAPAPVVDLPQDGAESELPEEDSFTGGGPIDDSGDSSPALVLGILAGVMVLILTPALLRTVRRRLRVRAIRSGRHPAVAAWRETLDAALDHGIPVRTTETARAVADRLARTLPLEARDPLRRLRLAVESESYARPRPSAGTLLLVQDVGAVQEALRSLSSVRRRLLAFLAPRSLVSRWLDRGD